MTLWQDLQPKSELFNHIAWTHSQLNNWRRILTAPFPASFSASTLYRNNIIECVLCLRRANNVEPICLQYAVSAMNNSLDFERPILNAYLYFIYRNVSSCLNIVWFGKQKTYVKKIRQLHRAEGGIEPLSMFHLLQIWSLHSIPMKIIHASCWKLLDNLLFFVINHVIW